jgi:hypothetical protein
VSSFCYLVIISSKCVLNSVGENGQPWPTSLLISASFNSFDLNFIGILFVFAVNNVSGIFLGFSRFLIGS